MGRTSRTEISLSPGGKAGSAGRARNSTGRGRALAICGLNEGAAARRPRRILEPAVSPFARRAFSNLPDLDTLFAHDQAGVSGTWIGSRQAGYSEFLLFRRGDRAKLRSR